MNYMFNKYLRKEKNSFPSLYDMFCLGDRVSRIYKDNSGNFAEYEGIILGINEEGIEVCWDKRNSSRKRSSVEDIGFTNCSKYEVFNGNDNFTPIKREY